MNSSRATLMLSGGLDSVVLAHELASQGYDFEALHFRFWPGFGQRSLECAERAASRLGFTLRIVELYGISELMCSLVPGAIVAADELDTGGDECDTRGQASPSAMLMLPAIAAYYSQAADRASIFLGVIKNQLDRNPSLYKALTELPLLITDLNHKMPAVRIILPYAQHDKVEVIRRGIDLGVPLDETWSCLEMNVDHPCGECPQCCERREALSELRVA